MNGTGDGKVESNQGQIKIIVRTLAIIAGACVLGLFVLIFCDKKIPSELWLLSSNVVTALISMLVKTTPTASLPPDKPSDTKQPTGKIEVPAQELETTQTI